MNKNKLNLFLVILLLIFVSLNVVSANDENNHTFTADENISCDIGNNDIINNINMNEIDDTGGINEEVDNSLEILFTNKTNQTKETTLEKIQLNENNSSLKNIFYLTELNETTNYTHLNENSAYNLDKNETLTNDLSTASKSDIYPTQIQKSYKDSNKIIGVKKLL